MTHIILYNANDMLPIKLLLASLNVSIIIIVIISIIMSLVTGLFFLVILLNQQ